MARYHDSFPTYVPVAERRRRAAKKAASMNKAGRDISPIEIAGRRIATTFWGEAWCNNLAAYSDYASRLPRGRTYVRNGSVLDLVIEAGRVRTLVSGTELYEVEIAIKTLSKERWKAIQKRCAGQIDSLVELLQGSISEKVMAIVTRGGEGLFPSPSEITLTCSCPDWATMCKHVAASLYGVGARLDHDPELLFTLRGVDPSELVEAALEQPTTRRGSQGRNGRRLETAELSSVFGIDIDMGTVSSGAALSSPQETAPTISPPSKAARSRTPAKKTAKKHDTAKKAAKRSKKAASEEVAASSQQRGRRVRRPPSQRRPK